MNPSAPASETRRSSDLQQRWRIMTQHLFFSNRFSSSGFFPKPFRQLFVLLLLTAAFGNGTASGQTPVEQTVRAGVVTVHQKPSETSEIVETISMGEVVKVLHRSGDWAIVMLSDRRVGWVRPSLMNTPPPLASVSKTDAETPSPKETIAPINRPDEVLFQVVLKVRSGRVRSAPNLEGAIHFGLQEGDVVDVLGEEGDWYRVRRPEDGDIGWAHRRLFEKKDIPTPPSRTAKRSEALRKTFEAAVKVDSGRVRQQPTTDAPVISGITRGEIVMIEDVRNDWYRVRLSSGQQGWAHESLFERTERMPALLTGIWTETLPDGSEKLVFELSGFQPPKTFAANDSDMPRVISDFANTTLANTMNRDIAEGGHLIKSVRIEQNNPQAGGLRIVADLNPLETYDVKQTYYKNTNHYVLTFLPVLSE